MYQLCRNKNTNKNVDTGHFFFLLGIQVRSGPLQVAVIYHCTSNYKKVKLCIFSLILRILWTSPRKCYRYRWLSCTLGERRDKCFQSNVVWGEPDDLLFSRQRSLLDPFNKEGWVCHALYSQPCVNSDKTVCLQVVQGGRKRESGIWTLNWTIMIVSWWEKSS